MAHTSYCWGVSTIKKPQSFLAKRLYGLNQVGIAAASSTRRPYYRDVSWIYHVAQPR